MRCCRLARQPDQLPQLGLAHMMGAGLNLSDQRISILGRFGRRRRFAAWPILLNP
jgi:hypothetical protein